MTLGKLALASALGMLVTGLAVYFLTSPPPAPPAALQLTAPSTPADAAPPDSSAERDAREAERLAEFEQEVEHLRALLDGSAPADASADAALPVDTSPDASPRPTPLAIRSAVIASEVPGGCKKALSDEAFDRLLQQYPALRQLPPENLRIIKNASPECPCTPDTRGQVLCEDWCRSQGFVPLLSGCGANHKCQCANL